MFANEYDIKNFVTLFATEETPNLAKGAAALQTLCDWTNQNSDGWPYWTKPLKASLKLVELLSHHEAMARSSELVDCQKPQLTAALTPIKSFYTRQGVDWTEMI